MKIWLTTKVFPDAHQYGRSFAPQNTMPAAGDQRFSCCMYAAKSSTDCGVSPNRPTPRGQTSEGHADDGYSPLPYGEDKILALLHDRLTFRCQMYLWCSALAEIAVIIAQTFPSLSVSKMILGNVIFGCNAGQIQFTTTAAIGITLGITGAVLRAWCYRELGKFFTFEMTIMKDHNLVKTGPYDVVRHPAYAATFMTNTAIFLLYATRGSWVRESGLLDNLPGKIITSIFAAMVALGPLGVMKRMKDEDRALRRRFGDEWDAWAAKVRYMLIPGLW